MLSCGELDLILGRVGKTDEANGFLIFLLFSLAIIASTVTEFEFRKY